MLDKETSNPPMILSEIWIYPIKSLGGIRLKESTVEEQGLKYDRRWMIVDENGKFITQRVNMKMALIDVSFHQEGLILSHRFNESKPVIVPYTPLSNHPLQVKVWNDTVIARTVCDQADAWLTAQLGKKVRIVEMYESTRRPMDPAYANSSNQLVSFADDFPFLLISQASLEDLNEKLTEPVEMMRFRPNFVVTGTDSFAEDSWNQIKIGNVDFKVAKPCERCILTTIDPHTGTKGLEPLKTLSTYRKINKQIFFGQNLIALQNGMVREGDKITL